MAYVRNVILLHCQGDVSNYKGGVDLKVSTSGVEIQGAAGITPTLGKLIKTKQSKIGNFICNMLEHKCHIRIRSSYCILNNPLSVSTFNSCMDFTVCSS